MAFELFSWVYISAICLNWGNLFVYLFFRQQRDRIEFSFPVLCLIGMCSAGIVAFYLSLFTPLGGWVKWIVQAPFLLYFLRASNRRFCFQLWTKSLVKPFSAEFFLFVSCLLMVLFLSTSPIIHPDTIHYHMYNIMALDKYAVIPGVVNLQLEFGFQSLWFAVTDIFSIPFFPTGTSYPLSGCFLFWVILFLTSKMLNPGAGENPGGRGVRAAGFLLLLLFSVLSWTQIRLTAASASPDFVAAVCVLLSFYYFVSDPGARTKESGFSISAFFAAVAFSVKASSILILLIPVYLVTRSLLKRNFRLAATRVLLLMLVLTPLFIRNVISTGYLFFPSAFPDFFNPDWKLPKIQLVRFQHYITAYARYPVAGDSAQAEFLRPFFTWLPVWWHQLYLVDKVMMLVIVLGALADLIFLRRWLKAVSREGRAAFLISLAGAILWFFHAPDPRFGTGFLLSLTCLQYFPLLREWKIKDRSLFLKADAVVKFASAILISAYVIYRGIYFFHPDQLIFPKGISETAPVNGDCNNQMKTMIFRDAAAAHPLPDSCKTFLLRGSLLKDGFKPLNQPVPTP